MPATIWEFQSKLDFWEYGQVELGANDGFKVTFEKIVRLNATLIKLVAVRFRLHIALIVRCWSEKR